MIVKLATQVKMSFKTWKLCHLRIAILQIFSNSVADALEYYKLKEPDDFASSQNTQKFSRRLNALFDTLNRRYAAEGMRNNSTDFKVN